LGMDTKVQIISSIQKYGRMRRYSKGRYLWMWIFEFNIVSELSVCG
jgi:hypothetical protein